MGRPSVLQLNVLNCCHHVAAQKAADGPWFRSFSTPPAVLCSGPLWWAERTRLLSPVVITTIKANPGPIQAAFVLSFISSVLESFAFQSSTQRQFLELVIICYIPSAGNRMKNTRDGQEHFCSLSFSHTASLHLTLPHAAVVISHLFFLLFLFCPFLLDNVQKKKSELLNSALDVIERLRRLSMNISISVTILR